MKLITLLLLLFVGHTSFAQTMTVAFESKTVSVEKGDELLIVPIVVKVKNKIAGQKVTIALPKSDSKITFQETDKEINEIDEATFYVIFATDYTVSTSVDVTINVSLTGAAVSDAAVITVKKAKSLNYTLDDYMHDSLLKLNYVTKVESTDNILTVYGYHADNQEVVAKRRILLKQNEVYTIYNNTFSAYKPNLSLITVPFKIRPEQGDLATNAQSGITNLGLNVDFFGWKWDRYYSDASKKTHKLGMGLWLAPSIEELDATTSNGFLAADKKSKQMFLSTGATISYSFNAISFVVVPIGFDFPTSAVGRKWVYEGKYWWGFGIAIEPKALAAILNK